MCIRRRHATPSLAVKQAHCIFLLSIFNAHPLFHPAVEGGMISLTCLDSTAHPFLSQPWFATWRQLHSDIVDVQDRGCDLANISYAVDMQEWWKVWYRLWRTMCHCPGDQSGCSTAPLQMNKAFCKWWRKCPTTLPPTWGDINLDEGSPWCIPCNSRSYFRTECGPRISWPSPCAITCMVVVTGRCMVSL